MSCGTRGTGGWGCGGASTAPGEAAGASGIGRKKFNGSRPSSCIVAGCEEDLVGGLV